jgi:hypothetical protein
MHSENERNEPRPENVQEMIQKDLDKNRTTEEKRTEEEKYKTP